jgi:hypothetical protein
MKKSIKISIQAFTATISLPARLYEANIKALKFAIKNKFTKDLDDLDFAKETLELMEKAIKNFNPL